jgi:hypothetical protein
MTQLHQSEKKIILKRALHKQVRKLWNEFNSGQSAVVDLCDNDHVPPFSIEAGNV